MTTRSSWTRLAFLFVLAVVAAAAAMPSSAEARTCRPKAGESRVYGTYGVSCGRAWHVVLGFVNADDEDGSTDHGNGITMLNKIGVTEWTLGAWTCTVKVRHVGYRSRYTRWRCESSYGEGFRWKYGPYSRFNTP